MRVIKLSKYIYPAFFETYLFSQGPTSMKKKRHQWKKKKTPMKKKEKKRKKKKKRKNKRWITEKRKPNEIFSKWNCFSANMNWNTDDRFSFVMGNNAFLHSQVFTDAICIIPD